MNSHANPSEGHGTADTGRAVGYSAARWWRPSAISSIILRQKSGMSSGLREVTRPWSVTTGASTHSAPAFLRSFLSDGHEVRRRPRTASASINVQGP